MQSTIQGFEQAVAEKQKVNDLFFEGEEFDNWAERDWEKGDEEGDFFVLSKTKIKLVAGKKLDKKGKPVFFLGRDITYNVRGEVIEDGDETLCKTLEELANAFEAEKNNILTFQDASSKGIMFDGRYFHKVHIADYKVYFGERVIEW